MTVIACIFSAGSAVAQTYATGQAAYDARDWATAETLWLDEAKSGSAEAKLGLGNIYDFGLTGVQQPQKAFDFYSQAAKAGLPEGAFNVGVMYDSGVGVAQDKRAAARWYAFAALDDFPRAQYNLGKIFAAGDGVARNSDFARYWLTAAGPRVPAALDAAEKLPTGEAGALTPPDLLGAELIENNAGLELRIAWAGEAAPEGATYRVEVVSSTEEQPATLMVSETKASAIAIPLNSADGAISWRVIQLAGTDYAASPWQRQDGKPVSQQSIGSILFSVNADDPRGQGYAERMGVALARSGATVRYDFGQTDLQQGGVIYRFDRDALLAENVAQFLPGLDGAGLQQDIGSGLAPGEVLVRLVFDPITE